MDEDLTQDKATVPQTIAIFLALGVFVFMSFAVITFLIYLSVMMWSEILN